MIFQLGVFQSVWQRRALTEVGFRCGLQSFEIHSFERDTKMKAARGGRAGDIVIYWKNLDLLGEKGLPVFNTMGCISN